MTAHRRPAANQPLPQYLLTHRKLTGLSQPEVAALLGRKDGSMLSRYELGQRVPQLDTALGLIAVYRAPIQELFAGRYKGIEAKVAQRARRLLKKFAKVKPPPEFTHKLATLSALAEPRRGKLDQLPTDVEDAGH